MSVIAALRSGTETQTSSGTAVANTGVYLSVDSLTFPVSAGVASALLGLADRFRTGAATNPWVALLICAAIGAFIIWQGWPVKADGRARGRHLAIGALNTLLLTASVLGVSAVATGESVV